MSTFKLDVFIVRALGQTFVAQFGCQSDCRADLANYEAQVVTTRVAFDNRQVDRHRNKASHNTATIGDCEADRIIIWKY